MEFYLLAGIFGVIVVAAGVWAWWLENGPDQNAENEGKEDMTQPKENYRNKTTE